LPWFYFDVSVGDDFTRDDVGFEYESLAVAEYEAARAASEISHDVLPKRRRPRSVCGSGMETTSCCLPWKSL
jgi:hypothetical protein